MYDFVPSKCLGIKFPCPTSEGRDDLCGCDVSFISSIPASTVMYSFETFMPKRAMWVAGVSFPLAGPDEVCTSAWRQSLRPNPAVGHVIRMFLEYSLNLSGEMKKEVINEMIRAVWLLQEEGTNLNTGLSFENKDVTKTGQKKLTNTNLM